MWQSQKKNKRITCYGTSLKKASPEQLVNTADVAGTPTNKKVKDSKSLYHWSVSHALPLIYSLNA